MLATALRSFLDFCLPRACPLCGKGADGPFCATCENELATLDAVPRCRRCAMPGAYLDAPCVQCRGRGVRPLRRVVSLGVHRGALKTAVHRLKFFGSWATAELLADRFTAEQSRCRWLASADGLVPVPLHWRRQVERGYNQSDVIARRLGKACGLKVLSPVERVRATAAQSEIHDRRKRILNMKQAFAVHDPAAVAGKKLVLVDDVMTTGATLSTLAKALKGAGAGSVSAVVISVADPKGRQFEVF